MTEQQGPSSQPSVAEWLLYAQIHLANRYNVPLDVTQALAPADLAVEAALIPATDALHERAREARAAGEEPPLVITQTLAGLEALSPLRLHLKVHNDLNNLLDQPTDNPQEDSR
ncbi:hypothetical protein PV646_34165 [Streptomyces sp. ID05-26A]|nr:hypothetical protein [Streptomyces sp. ID05-26A]